MATVLGTFYEPSLKNIIDQQSLKWIFVGGKGGVGKTTVSCCLAIQLSRVRESVLLVSTDPAHSLSDAFGQKFSTEPVLAEGFTNLHVVELDLAAEKSTKFDDFLKEDPMEEMRRELQTMVGACSWKILLRLTQRMDHAVVVFDTGHAGHTLRMLAAPMTLAKQCSALHDMINQVGPIISHVADLLGMPDATDLGSDFQSASGEPSGLFKLVVDTLKDADKTTFVCVCLAEFLPLYEMERLIDQLSKYGMDTHNIVVNQLNHPQTGDRPCQLCIARHKLQAKYLEQIEDLYQEDFHITKLPLMTGEVLRMFGGEEVDDNMSTIPWREMFGKVTSHLRNPDKTTFVGVCIAEFLSLYETERLMQKLTVYGIDSHNLVVNQLHFSTPRDDQACPFCSSRRTMQIKYMEQIASLYRDMHVTKLPLLGEEVRGVDTLEPFSQHLLHPYIPHTPPPHFPSDDH